MNNLPLVSQTVSTKFVPIPSPRDVLNSTFTGLKSFSNQLRWIDFFSTKKFPNDNNANLTPNLGLGTDFKGPTANAPKGRDFVETFIKVLIRAILSNFKVNYSTESFVDQTLSGTGSMVAKFLGDLRLAGDYVIVPSDKTNNWLKIKLLDYESLALKAISEVAEVTTRESLTQTFTSANNFVNDYLASNKISTKEADYLKNSLKSKSLPWFKILIKDHKPLKLDGSFETRLITPCGNFMSGFNKLGSSAIKRIFERNKVKFTWLFADSFEAKSGFDKVKVLPNSSLILLDVKNMYPSIHFNLIKLAVNHYTESFSAADRLIIDNSLGILEFGMLNIFCKFKDKFYRYVGSGGECALSQGGYESAFLADLVINYVFERSGSVLGNEIYYKRCFKDDAFLVSHNLDRMGIEEKINLFQNHVKGYAPSLEFKVDYGDHNGKSVD